MKLLGQFRNLIFSNANQRLSCCRCSGSFEFLSPGFELKVGLGRRVLKVSDDSARTPNIRKTTSLRQSSHFFLYLKPFGIKKFFMTTAILGREAVTGLSAASVLGGEPVLQDLPRSVLEWIALVVDGFEGPRKCGLETALLQ